MINNHSGQHAQAVHLYRWLPALFGILDDDYLEELITNKVHWVELHSNETLFQGDGIKNMPVVKLPETKVEMSKCIILSNTCDISPENIRKFPNHICYCPIISLEKYQLCPLLVQKQVIEMPG